MTTIPPGALVRDRELPELGPGRIAAELKGGASRIVFEHEDEMRDVDLSRVDVVRMPLIPGTKVDVLSGRLGDEETQPGEVVEAQLPDTPAELCDYVVRMEEDDEERTVSEAEVFPREPESTAPLDQFGALFWRGPFRFFARWGMHRTVSRLFEDAEGLPSLIGARLDPQPHQVRAVREALWAPEPRFILADASQRDRLVEAGLIVQSLTARNPDCRTLVVTPGLRSREWQSQLDLRFGGRDYTRVTESRVAGLEFHELAGVFGDDRMVVSTDLIRYNRDARTMLAGEGWDVVVIASAHRLEAGGEAYEFARELSERAEASIVTSPMPRTADPSDLSALFALARPDEYAPGETDELETYVDEQEDLWGAMLASLDALDGGLAEDELEDLKDRWRTVSDLDPGIADDVDRLEEGGEDELEELLRYVQSFHGFADIAVRTPVESLEDVDVDWPDRDREILEVDPDPEEEGVRDKLDEMPIPEDPDPAQKALRTLYYQRFWETPERFLELLNERGEALEKGADGEGVPDLVDRLLLAPDPTEEDAIWHRIVESAAPLPDEKEWIGGMLGVVQGWQNAVGREPARFQTATAWIEDHLDEEAIEEPPEPEADHEDDEADADDENETARRKVLVVSQSRRLGEAFHSHLMAELGEETAELYHCELPESMTADAVERFRHDDECRALIVDELGAEGHGLEVATAVVHLQQPLSPERVDARLTRLDGTQRDNDVVSVVVRGGGEVETALTELYDDVLGLYGDRPGPIAWDFPAIEEELIEAVGSGGAEGLEKLNATWREQVEADAADEARAFQASIDPRPSQLESVAEFTELLDFVDGIDDALPVRHWARMVGIDDHRVRPGVYDFKWHWSSVRRDLPGFDIPEGDDPSEWADEQTVRYLSGTFSRRHALDDESLEFFAPGHLLVDALIDDAMSPTDGRATVFARRLGGEHRGNVYAVIVGQCDLNRDCLGELDPPQGLIRRTHRRFWPESATAVVEVDLQGNRDPRVVDDPDLVRRLEESYEGPEADQKIEYEMLVRTIQDASQFRSMLREAVEVGLDDLRDERGWLVDDAADRLEEDFRRDIDYWEAFKQRHDDEAAQERADRQIAMRRRLVESVRDYAIDVDALALVVGGTPEVLMP